MENRNPAWSNERVETFIGNLLRAGVLVSAVVVLAGGVLYLVHFGGSDPDHRVFRGEPSDLRTLSGIVRDAVSFRSRGLIQLGLLLLIATPIARVAFSIFAFFRQRDRTYVFLTLVVLLILLFSLFGGKL